MPIPPRTVTPSLLQVDAILKRLSGSAAVEEVLRFLRSEHPHLAWIGVYRVDGPDLRLDAWQGDRPTEHTTIPIDRGLCGRAVRDNATVLVADVAAEPEYLACFLETRSELIVPIRRDGRPIGEIDVDGTTLGAFDRTDAAFLERVAEKLAPVVGASGAGAGAPSSPPPP